MSPPLAILFDRLGPYHAARIAAAAEQYPTVAVEFYRDCRAYGWDQVETDSRFSRHTIVPEGDDSRVTRVEFARRIFRALSEMGPQAIAVPGWYHYGSLLALAWAQQSRTPAIMMSASQALDAPRHWLKERVKTRLVKLCSSALVGGERQSEYIQTLGMPSERVLQGYDVVDNEYFAANAARVRRDSRAQRARLALPSRFFLTSCRFVPKKNLLFLLHAYASYRRRAAANAPHLVLLGDGPLMPALVSLRSALRLDDVVHFPGFKQYDELPAYYALAETFVLASTVEQWGLVVNEAMASGLPVLVSRNCGCLPELVRDGENGFAFDPNDSQALSELFEYMDVNDSVRHSMARRSQELVARISPSVFANQMRSARDVALNSPPKAAQAIDWILLAALSLH